MQRARWACLVVAVGAVLPASACGRTGLELLPSPPSADGGSEEAPPLDGGVDATPDASFDAEDGPDVRDAHEDTSDVAACGSPWVLFALASSTRGGAGESYKIYARRADGSDGHVLLLPEAQVVAPSVSPDGTELLYGNSSNSALFLYRFADLSNEELATQGGVVAGAVSPDGAAVAFGDGQNLFLVGTAADAGAQRSLVVEAQPNAAGSPVFTKDSSTVVFTTAGDIEAVGVDGSGRRVLVAESSQSLDPFPAPTFSPDYAELAAIVSCDGTTLELRAYAYEALPASCGSGRLVASIAGLPSAFGPTWGPSGLIAFSDGRDVFTVSAAGGTPTSLTGDMTSPTVAATDPTWAPSCTPLR